MLELVGPYQNFSSIHVSFFSLFFFLHDEKTPPILTSQLRLFTGKSARQESPLRLSRSIPGGLSPSFDFSKDSCIVSIEACFFQSSVYMYVYTHEIPLLILLFSIHPTALACDGFLKFVIGYIVIFTLYVYIYVYEGLTLDGTFCVIVVGIVARRSEVVLGEPDNTGRMIQEVNFSMFLSINPGVFF